MSDKIKSMSKKTSSENPQLLRKTFGCMFLIGFGSVHEAWLHTNSKIDFWGSIVFLIVGLLMVMWSDIKEFKKELSQSKDKSKTV